MNSYITRLKGYLNKFYWTGARFIYRIICPGEDWLKVEQLKYSQAWLRLSTHYSASNATIFSKIEKYSYITKRNINILQYYRT